MRLCATRPHASRAPSSPCFDLGGRGFVTPGIDGDDLRSPARAQRVESVRAHAHVFESRSYWVRRDRRAPCARARAMSARPPVHARTVFAHTTEPDRFTRARWCGPRVWYSPALCESHGHRFWRGFAGVPTPRVHLSERTSGAGTGGFADLRGWQKSQLAYTEVYRQARGCEARTRTSARALRQTSKK